VYGARLEGHFRVNGEKGALELFAGYERRVDATPRIVSGPATSQSGSA